MILVSNIDRLELA